MANTTRYGFAGGQEAQPPEDSGDETRRSRTVPGRDRHLETAPSKELPPPAETPSGVAKAGPLPVAKGRAASGKSLFPAMAGFWGRRNTQGVLTPLTETGLLTRPNTDEKKTPRSLLKPLLIVAFVALSSCALVLYALGML